MPLCRQVSVKSGPKQICIVGPIYRKAIENAPTAALQLIYCLVGLKSTVSLCRPENRHIQKLLL